MIKKMKKLFCLLMCMMLMSSCMSYAYTAATPYGDDVIVVRSEPDVVGTTVVAAASAAVMLDYIFAWNGHGYYRYYCTPYYAPRPYYWRGPRHYAPHYWRRLPPARSYSSQHHIHYHFGDSHQTVNNNYYGGRRQTGNGHRNGNRNRFSRGR